MTALQPPPLATWLLRQFDSGARNEPLIGDMVEEYRAGRFSLWYWRQVLVAILQSCVRDIERIGSLLSAVWSPRSLSIICYGSSWSTPR